MKQLIKAQQKPLEYVGNNKIFSYN